MNSTINPEIAACGLFCGSCRAYKKGKCPGCQNNLKAEKWCTVRRCCIEHDYQSCADCRMMPLNDCPKFNNFMGKIFGLIFRSDRRGCIERLREIGNDAFAAEMRLSGSYNRPVKKQN